MPYLFIIQMVKRVIRRKDSKVSGIKSNLLPLHAKKALYTRMILRNMRVYRPRPG